MKKIHPCPQFTLIELLIVVAIIAILAAMMLPALNKAIDLAAGLNCAANLKQIGTYHTMYGMDNNDWSFPTYRTDSDKRSVHWMNRFAIDYHMPKLICSAEDTAIWSVPTVTQNVKSCYNNNYGYGNNSELFGYSETSTWSNFSKFSQIQNRASRVAARPIAFADVTTDLLRKGSGKTDGRPCFRASSVTASSIPTVAIYTFPGQTTGSYPIYARHGGRAAVAFLDGGADQLTPTQITRGYKRYLRPTQYMKVWKNN